MTRRGAAVIGVGFIGELHVDALRRAGVEVVGVLGSSPGRAREKARRMGVDRVYGDLAELLADPAVQVVHVTSPNHLHAEQSLAAIEAGRHVVCEKPLAMDAADGLRMLHAAGAAGVIHAVCFNIRFYPVLHEAAARVRAGAVGPPRLVSGHYLQDWLLRDTDWNWRLDPAQAGSLRAVADIGSHWLDLARFVTGLEVTEVLADLHTFVRHRRRPTGPVETFAAAHSPEHAGEREVVEMASDDAAGLLLRYGGDARGVLTVSQVSAGRKNTVNMEVDGTDASLAWSSEAAEQLWLGHRDRPNEQLWRDPALLGPDAGRVAHYPGGHAEGFAETFLGLFERVYADVAAGGPSAGPAYPTFADGLEGLFVEEAIRRSAAEGRWVSVERRKE
ncbi:Gfo/Idh/MocA family protein [Nonomuraea sp. M3C6]|uniref:Gfo/Idh/MocA family protein n=1 Tax=Nonomuraea marmarensis TaxID=3351344 RepID=A0ABW7APY6_9ACTN